MTEIPKIVYDRLRAASLRPADPGQNVPEPAHLDVDLLTAFAERSLSTSERDSALHHLSLCGDCRDLLALALPAAGASVEAPAIADETDAALPGKQNSTPFSPKSTRLVSPDFGWRRLAWPNLRWAALAAGIAVAAALLLLHPGKLNQPTLPAAHRQIAPSAPVTNQTTDSLQPNSKSPRDRKIASGKTAEPSPPWESLTLLARNRPGADRANTAPPARSSIVFSPATSLGRETMGGQAIGGQAPREQEPSIGSSGGQVTEAAVEANPQLAPESSSDATLIVKNDVQNDVPADVPAIEKAKPALLGSEARSSEAQSSDPNQRPQSPATGTARATTQIMAQMPGGKLPSPATQNSARLTMATQNVTWKIANGTLRKSSDDGQNWQNAFQSDHPLLCYASHGADVWAGGRAGTLFHSSDNGVTWMAVRPSAGNKGLRSDITHIDLSSSPAAVVFTSNNELWSSVDAGKTWSVK